MNDEDADWDLQDKIYGAESDSAGDHQEEGPNETLGIRQNLAVPAMAVSAAAEISNPRPTPQP